MRTLIKTLLTVLVLAYVGLGALFYFQQDQMTFPAPTQYPKLTPADDGLAFEDLHIPVAGSEQIHAWWVPATQPSEKVLLMFHGNGYVLEQAAAPPGELMFLHHLGPNLLLVDYNRVHHCRNRRRFDASPNVADTIPARESTETALSRPKSRSQ